MAVAVQASPMTRDFFPYSFNGGSVVAMAGDDFTVIASDTRLSEGFMIHTREMPKTYKLTNTTILGCCGFHGDVLQLTKNIEARLKMYEHEHCRTMSASGIAQMLSTMLYYKRFFPYYVYNIVAGLDSEGKGCIYSFDPVGSYEREKYRAEGSSASMLQPLLDNQIGRKNMQNASDKPFEKSEVVQLIKDVFISAAERDINTGDGVLIHVITKDGIEEEFFPLRKD